MKRGFLQTAALSPGADLVEQRAWLQRLARNLLHSEAAEDVVQDACASALAHGAAFGAGGRAWLATVVRNIVRKDWRSAVRRERRERAASVANPEVAPSPERAFLRYEAHLELANAVSELAEPFRSTIILRYFEDLSPTEIAERLGIPAGTVRWRTKRALDELRQRLAEEGTHARRRLALLAFPGGELGREAAGGLLLGMKVSGKVGFVGLAVGLMLAALLLWGPGGKSPPGPPARPSASIAPLDETRNQGAPEAKDRSLGPALPAEHHTIGIPKLRVASKDADPTEDRAPPPRLLPARGEGMKDRRPGAPRADFAALQAAVKTRMTEARGHIQRCLDTWPGDHPDLGRKVILVVGVDARGLQDVWLKADDGTIPAKAPRLEVSSGPLRCLTEGIYPVDWSDVTTEPGILTVPFGPGTDWASPR